MKRMVRSGFTSRSCHCEAHHSGSCIAIVHVRCGAVRLKDLDELMRTGFSLLMVVLQEACCMECLVMHGDEAKVRMTFYRNTRSLVILTLDFMFGKYMRKLRCYL